MKSQCYIIYYFEVGNVLVKTFSSERKSSNLINTNYINNQKFISEELSGSYRNFFTFLFSSFRKKSKLLVLTQTTFVNFYIIKNSLLRKNIIQFQVV